MGGGREPSGEWGEGGSDALQSSVVQPVIVGHAGPVVSVIVTQPELVNEWMVIGGGVFVGVVEIVSQGWKSVTILVPHPAWQCEGQGVYKVEVGTALGQPHGTSTMDSNSQAGLAQMEGVGGGHQEWWVSFVTVGQGDAAETSMGVVRRLAVLVG